MLLFGKISSAWFPFCFSQVSGRPCLRQRCH